VTTTDELSNDELCNGRTVDGRTLRASRARWNRRCSGRSRGRVRWPASSAAMESHIADHDPPLMRDRGLARRGAATGNHRLVDCDRFVTIEPAPWCAGAMVSPNQTPDLPAPTIPSGRIHSVMQVLHLPQLNHRVEVTGGVAGGPLAPSLLADVFSKPPFSKPR